VAGQHERQDRGAAVEGLDLGLLIDAEHDRGVGRVQIQPNDVSHLVDELRIGGQLERLCQMGLETEGPPDPADGRLAHPGGLGHPPG
jgi:hypothetical protein